jgi:rod shape-determining protein MreC
MKRFRFAIIAVLVIAVIHFVPFLDGAEAWLVGGFAGAGSLLRTGVMATGGFLNGFWRTPELEKEILALKSEVGGLNLRLAENSALSAENSSLKDLLGFKKKSGYDLVAAEVIGADPDATIRAIIINRGLEDGIVRGDAVIVGDGVFVGKVERVSAGRATVLLPTDPRSAVSVMLSEHPEADGVAQGEKGLVISMALIPQHAEVAEGDKVVTTGRENLVPRGLFLGVIESVTKVPSEPFISATVVPALDPLSLTAVAVIRAK